MPQILEKYGSKIISRHPILKFMVKIDNCKVGKLTIFLFWLISFDGVIICKWD